MGILDLELAREFEKLIHDPLGWVTFAYQWGKPETMLEGEAGPELWQAEVLEHIGAELAAGRSPVRVAVRSGHGVGKSSLMAMIRGWAMSTFVDTRGLVTANTGAQLVTKTLPEFAKWHYLACNSHWFDGSMAYRSTLGESHRETWRFDAVTWSAENPAAFAGLHNAGRRILLMFDEASEIPPIIWETAEGALTDVDTEIIWLAFGNPTTATGRFSQCFGADRKLWRTLEVDARTVRRTNKELIAEWAETYGDDSDFFRIRVKGQAPRVGSLQFIGDELVEFAGKRPVLAATMKDPLIYGVDVARFGDDASTLYRRRGYDARSWPPFTWRGLDTMALAARIAAQAVEDQPDAIFVDETGVGAGVVDRLKQLGRQCIGVNFGTNSDNMALMASGAPAERYANKRAEMWGSVRNWLNRGGAIPASRELRDDLTGVQYGFDRDGRIQLERKEDMKKRGLASPDHGDGLALTFAYPVASAGLEREAARLRKLEQPRGSYDPRRRILGG